MFTVHTLASFSMPDRQSWRVQMHKSILKMIKDDVKPQTQSEWDKCKEINYLLHNQDNSIWYLYVPIHTYITYGNENIVSFLTIQFNK